MVVPRRLLPGRQADNTEYLRGQLRRCDWKSRATLDLETRSCASRSRGASVYWPGDSPPSFFGSAPVKVPELKN